ncbi:hypothetical protein AG1IA_06798 [Rhizoctonia solani AG-1 IA]|uniref:Uncharacterized protein n=1 Tax=Thanatephorus cucumeris (strain AG1-IA) TaxID=983506 RepID=L8WLY1_THACA|nr:hypothetical protein AG1IA_06798 [Rhizoctonia solani AG-1 IA]
MPCFALPYASKAFWFLPVATCHFTGRPNKAILALLEIVRHAVALDYSLASTAWNRGARRSTGRLEGNLGWCRGLDLGRNFGLS